MFETWEAQKRITEARRLTARVVDHLQYLLDIHENNAIVLYSDALSKQIPNPMRRTLQYLPGSDAPNRNRSPLRPLGSR